MDYSKNYYNTLQFSDRIQQEISKGKKPTGLGARVETQPLEVEDFNSVKARYISFVREMFTPSEEEMGVQEEGWSPDAEYMTSAQAMAMEPPEGEAPSPKRNPNYWKDSKFLEGVTADEGSIDAILRTIKTKESGGDYTVKNPNASASGAYQFIDSTWRTLTNKYGVGTEFKSARSAPKDVQDAVARRYVKEILTNNNNDVTKVPLVWYTGNAQGKLSQEAIDLNNGLTPQQYQNMWMRSYSKNIGKK